MLQGLIVCGRCDYAFYGKPVSLQSGQGQAARLRLLPLRRNATLTGSAANASATTNRSAPICWKRPCGKTCARCLENPRRIEREYQRRLKRDARGSQIDEHLPSRIQKVKRGIARLVDAYEEGLLEKSEFEPRLRRSRDRLAKLEAEAKKQAENEAQRAELQLVIGHLQEFADRIKSGLHDADWLTRREILRALVKRVEVDEAQVRVIYRIDPLPFDQGPPGAVCKIVGGVIVPPCGLRRREFRRPEPTSLAAKYTREHSLRLTQPYWGSHATSMPGHSTVCCHTTLSPRRNHTRIRPGLLYCLAGSSRRSVSESIAQDLRK